MGISTEQALAVAQQYAEDLFEEGGGSTGIWKPSVSDEGVISWEKSTSTVTPEEQNIKGPRGETGETGATGETGPAGPGLASGGVAGSMLFKSSNDDYATEWVDSGIATVEGDPATAETDSAGIGVKTVVDIEPIQAGSGNPSPENVREISGFDSVEVEGCGKNILPCTVEALKRRNTSGTWDGLIYTAPNGVKFTVSVDANSNVTGINISCSSTTSGSIEFKLTEWTNNNNNLSNGTYCLSGSNNTNDIGIIANKVGGSGNNWYTVGNPVIEITDERKIGDVYIYVGNGTPATNVTITPQIERGSTATTYEPYNPVTDLTIPLGETVYGGTLDVESGTLTVDRGFITFDGSEDEIISTYDEGELFMVDYANFGDLVPKKDINGIPTNRISPSATRMGNAAFALYWRGLPSDVRTVAALRTWLASNNLQVCYELATPYTISLSPHQIKLIQGVNNLSTNAHSISLTYRKGKVAMNSDLEGLADSVNVLSREVDSFGIKPLTATALSDAVSILTFSAMKINKNVIFSCRVIIAPTEEGSMPLFAINGVECPFYHTAIGRNTARGIDGRWSIDKDTNILTWTVVSTELSRSNDIMIQGVLAVK